MRINKSYEYAVSLLSPELRNVLTDLSEEIRETTYEIRIRKNKPITLYGKYNTVFVCKDGTCSSKPSENSLKVTGDLLQDSFNRICSYSVHTHQKDINNGFITTKYGNRVGVCGTAVCEDNKIRSIKNITSLNIRISKEIPGCGEKIAKELNGESIIIAGPPNSGKTTVLRDIIRHISGGLTGTYIKTAVIDERREISAITDGEICADLGFCTDILDGYPKSKAIDIAVRTLSPEYIVCDEISRDDEIESIEHGTNSGIKFIVTVHAGNEDEIMSRKQIEKLINTYSFSKLYLLDSKDNIGKIKAEYNVGELRNEIYRRKLGYSSMYADRL